MRPTKVQINPAVSAEGGQGTVRREPAPETESAPSPGAPGPEADERDEGAHEEAGYGYGV